MVEVIGSSLVVSSPSISTPSTVSSRSSTKSSSSISPSSLSAASKASSKSSTTGTTKKRQILDGESSISSTASNIKKRLIFDDKSSCAKTKSKNQEPKTKMAAYEIDWFDPSATIIECLKHTNIGNLPVTQEGQLTFLLSKFETIDLKTAFAYMIGKVGPPARSKFYPLPFRKDKVIRGFLELIYDGRSIIVNDSKNAFR